MHRSPLILLTALSLLLASCGPRSADELVSAYQSVEIPTIEADRRSEPGYVVGVMEQRRRAYAERSSYGFTLFDRFPDDPRTPDVFVDAANDAVLHAKDRPPAVERLPTFMDRYGTGDRVADAEYIWLVAVAHESGFDLDATAPRLDRFAEVAPDDVRLSQMLLFIADRNLAEHPGRSATLLRRALAQGPNAYTERVEGKLRQIEYLGRPVELAFNDAITGEWIDLSRLRGKVIVLDFWATWCGPCVRELPNLQRLYDTYSGDGLEIIGISLDKSPEEGGLERLRTFIDKHGHPWPQYYEGRYWDCEFSRAWGIRAIPALFVIDREGRLHSTTARHRLDEIVPELLGIEAPN